MSQILRVSLLS